MPSFTSMAGMVVAAERISVSILSCFGSRCCTITKPMPVSAGNARRSRVNASRPPADAPTPTIGNISSRFPPPETRFACATEREPSVPLRRLPFAGTPLFSSLRRDGRVTWALLRFFAEGDVLADFFWLESRIAALRTWCHYPIVPRASGGWLKPLERGRLSKLSALYYHNGPLGSKRNLGHNQQARDKLHSSSGLCDSSQSDLQPQRHRDFSVSLWPNGWLMIIHTTRMELRL